MALTQGPELAFYIPPVERVLSFEFNGIQFFPQSASAAPNSPPRGPANPFLLLKEETLPQLDTIADYLCAHAQELGSPTGQASLTINNDWLSQVNSGKAWLYYFGDATYRDEFCQWLRNVEDQTSRVQILHLLALEGQ